MSLQQFDIHSLAHWSSSPVCLIVGKHGTGKSVLATDMLRHRQTVSKGIIFSGKEETDFNVYKNNNLLQYDKYQSHVVQELLDHRQEISDAFDKKSREARQEILTETKTAVVLDNCMHDMAWTHDVAIQNLFADNTRSLGVMCIMTMSYPMSMPYALRVKVDYIFILNEPDVAGRRKIYEHYGIVPGSFEYGTDSKSLFGDFETFCGLLDQCTGHHECLVISNVSTSDNLYDNVFRYTADLH
jgi:hypothetical protein